MFSCLSYVNISRRKQYKCIFSNVIFNVCRLSILYFAACYIWKILHPFFAKNLYGHINNMNCKCNEVNITSLEKSLSNLILHASLFSFTDQEISLLSHSLYVVVVAFIFLIQCVYLLDISIVLFLLLIYFWGDVQFSKQVCNKHYSMDSVDFKLSCAVSLFVLN